MNRPDDVKCVQVNENEKPTKTWCGRGTSSGLEWVFVDATHAILNARNEGLLMICPACAKEMRRVIKMGTYES